MKKQMILLGMLMAFCMAEAKVTLPALFTDNMILQQKSNVIFHGHSSTKKEVINFNYHFFFYIFLFCIFIAERTWN